MKRPEPIELENNLGPDVTGEINRVPWMAYDVDEMDIYIAEKDAEIAELKAENERLKKQSSLNVHDDSLRVRQLKRKIADNSEKILELQKSLDVALSEVYSLLDKIESLKASHYAESVDAGMRERMLRRALWIARAMRAEAQWNRQLRDAGIAFAIGENKSWDSWNQKQKKWQRVERKCRAKAEEYK